MEIDSLELPMCSLKIMQRKEEEEDTESDVRMQQQSESTLHSVEEHKENLQKIVHRMKECKKDVEQFVEIKYTEQQRVMRTVKLDKVLVAQRQENLCDLDEEIIRLTEERDRLEKRMQKYAFYSHYMDTFVKATNVGAQQGMARFETLVLARDNLQESTHELHERIQDAQANLKRFTKESNDFHLQLTSETTRYQRQLDRAQQNRMHWERTWNRIQKTATQQTILLGKIRMSCLNMYRSVCDQSRVCREFPVQPEDTHGQLETVL
ncbi:coiled-coil domain-containing protein 42-like [Conger conger]|uniref:coiled-coil domain-containing protein 42-like n=1 Tax=Conger conger TaxID=82655 RepID=UPI002A5A3782|nr:coiled-coil domain-containing protein 42-like [Conger conger]